MPQVKLFAFVAALSLLQHVVAQQSCINVCTGSANVLTQLKSCSGCGTDDWACFCRCQQYMNALMSCVQQNCVGSDIENSVVSFCSSQGVPIAYSSGSVSIGSSTIPTSSTTSASSATSPTTLSTTGTATGATGGGAFLSSAVAASSTSSGSSGYSGSSFTASQSSDISSYLATAIPASARTQSSDACFVNTPYSYYSTPTWYSTLPTQAQSYYSSVNQGNTAACTLSPSAAAALAGSPSGGHHGLSAGAIAGIVIGALVAMLLLALLLWLCLRRRRRARRDAAAARAPNYQPRNMGPGAYGNEKGLVNGSGPTSNGRAPYGNVAALAGAGVGAALPGQTRQSHHNHGNGMVGAAPLTNGRAAQGPYANEGSNRGLNGLAAAPIGQTGSHMGRGAGGLGGPTAAVGGAALGAGRTQPDYGYSTTTTTRTIMRSKPKRAPVPSNPPSPPRTYPPPVTNNAPVKNNLPHQSVPSYTPIENDPSRSFASRSAGRRAF